MCIQIFIVKRRCIRCINKCEQIGEKFGKKDNLFRGIYDFVRSTRDKIVIHVADLTNVSMNVLAARQISTFGKEKNVSTWEKKNGVENRKGRPRRSRNQSKSHAELIESGLTHLLGWSRNTQSQ